MISGEDDDTFFARPRFSRKRQIVCAVGNWQGFAAGGERSLTLSFRNLLAHHINEEGDRGGLVRPHRCDAVGGPARGPSGDLLTQGRGTQSTVLGLVLTALHSLQSLAWCLAVGPVFAHVLALGHGQQEAD